jgi:hypothetical protein
LQKKKKHIKASFSTTAAIDLKINLIFSENILVQN